MKSIIGCLFVILLLASTAAAQLETRTFAAGTIVIPFDDKQNDTIKAFGLVHAILRNDSSVYRIIEPPDVILKTDLTPSGTTYSGGPILVLDADRAKFNTAMVSFPTVTYTNLTEDVTSTQVFPVSQETTILVIISDNSIHRWGRTDKLLSDMRIPFDTRLEREINANPSIINNYSLVVVDCAAYGDEPLLFPKMPDNVKQILKSFAENGGEVIFTDISMMAMEDVFDNVTIKKSEIKFPAGQNVTSNVHNPPINKDGSLFSSEFPSQYNGSNPLEIFIFGDGRSIESILSNDVRIMVNTDDYAGNHRNLAVYFPYGKGIVEAIEYHPGDQVGESEKLTAFFYGNKFIHPPAPVININKTVNKSEVDLGAVVKFTLNITNVGQEDFTSVKVVDILPVGLEYADNAQPPETTAVQNPDGTTTIIWNLGPMQKGSFNITTFDAKAIVPGVHVNFANATGTAPSGTVTAEDTETVTVTFKPDIDIVKTINGSKMYFASRNSTVEIKLVIVNTGEKVLDTVYVEDRLPSGLKYIGGAVPPPDIHNGVIVWNNVGPLSPGKSKTITFKAKAMEEGIWINEAITKGTNTAQQETVTANDSADVVVRKPTTIGAMTSLGIVLLVSILAMVAVKRLRKP